MSRPTGAAATVTVVPGATLDDPRRRSGCVVDAAGAMVGVWYRGDGGKIVAFLFDQAQTRIELAADAGAEPHRTAQRQP